MSGKFPRPDAALEAGIARLQSSPDYRKVLALLDAQLAWTKNALMVAPATEVAVLQGRALQLQDTIQLLTKDP